MEINQNLNENIIIEKLNKIKNSIYRQIKDKLKIKKFEGIMLGYLSDIWDIKNKITLDILIVKLKI